MLVLRICGSLDCLTYLFEGLWADPLGLQQVTVFERKGRPHAIWATPPPPPPVLFLRDTTAIFEPL